MVDIGAMEGAVATLDDVLGKGEVEQREDSRPRDLLRHLDLDILEDACSGLKVSSWRMVLRFKCAIVHIPPTMKYH